MTTEKLKSIYPAYSEFNWWVRLVLESGQEILFTDMDYISCITLVRASSINTYKREKEIKIIDYGQMNKHTYDCENTFNANTVKKFTWRTPVPK